MAPRAAPRRGTNRTRSSAAPPDRSAGSCWAGTRSLPRASAPRRPARTSYGIRLARLQPRDRDERVVVVLDAERGLLPPQDLDLAGPVGLDPDRRAATRPGSAASGQGSAWPRRSLRLAHEPRRAARACRPPPRSRAGARHRRPRARCARRPRGLRPSRSPGHGHAPTPTVARATSAQRREAALVQDRRLDSVPAGAEARLRDRLGVRVLARRRLVERPRGECMHQRGQRAGVVERWLDVHLPHLDGSKPPDVRERPTR